ncbi:hypothetical protein [Paenibacillus chungangensis]|uniref:DUF2157 domain-containing protein n=1 Tax=Paenibacillus chungangensis TaxID=696535 RepID=A0ABW3HM98_9BACL
MDHRKEIIVKEIQHWRRSKVLPDQYCDFLLNLYRDPDTDSGSDSGQDAPGRTIGKAVMAMRHATGKQWLLTFGTFTLISFVVLYFSFFHPLLQIAIIVGGTLILLWAGKRWRGRSEAAGLSISSTGMLLLLGGGLYLLNQHELSAWGWQAVFISVCALFWIIYGIRMGMQVLHLCGWLALLLTYSWLLSRFSPEPKWFEVQLYWLPLSILFGWSSWFLHRWTKAVPLILFAVCALTWFMPEVYSLAVLKETEWIQLQLLTKFALGGTLLYLMRKQWMVWVA